MKTLNRSEFDFPKYTTRAIQFGEGNFLRAFLDWQIDKLNKATDLDMGIAVIRPIDTDFPNLLNMQDGLYTCVVRGIDENNTPVEQMDVISSVNVEIPIYQQNEAYLKLAEDENIRFVFSNTTEAGIAFNSQDKLSDEPAITFPGKLTQWLYHRYCFFKGDASKGLVIIPCELIDYNGDKLKEIIEQYVQLWNLEKAFLTWLEQSNTFCSTLVDRIVTGHPREELPALEDKVGYQDQFMVTAEFFYLFVIQGPKSLAKELCLEGQNLNIKIVDDIKPYKERKVAILNGAHTAMVPVAYMSGLDTVGEAMNNKVVERFVNTLISDEIIPVLSLPKDELAQFAQDVIKRFKNPYIKHQLISISLNSMTKWKTRLLPQLVAFADLNQSAPKLISLSFAAQILMQRGIRDDEKIELSDDQDWMEFFALKWQGVADGDLTLATLVSLVCANKEHWGCDLNLIPGFTEQVTVYLESMVDQGTLSLLTDVCGG